MGEGEDQATMKSLFSSLTPRHDRSRLIWFRSRLPYNSPLPPRLPLPWSLDSSHRLSPIIGVILSHLLLCRPQSRGNRPTDRPSDELIVVLLSYVIINYLGRRRCFVTGGASKRNIQQPLQDRVVIKERPQPSEILRGFRWDN